MTRVLLIKIMDPLALQNYDDRDEAVKDRAKERKRLYKKKNRKSQRCGRLERLQETIHDKHKEVKRLSQQTTILKKEVCKTNMINKKLKRLDYY